MHGKNSSLSIRQQAQIGWELIRDPEIPLPLRIATVTMPLLYVLFPVDISPDLIPLLGQVDDLGVVGVALMLLTVVTRHTTPALVDKHAYSLGFYGGMTPSNRTKLMIGAILLFVGLFLLALIMVFMMAVVGFALFAR